MTQDNKSKKTFFPPNFFRQFFMNLFFNILFWGTLIFLVTTFKPYVERYFFPAARYVTSLKDNVMDVVRKVKKAEETVAEQKKQVAEKVEQLRRVNDRLDRLENLLKDYQERIHSLEKNAGAQPSPEKRIVFLNSTNSEKGKDSLEKLNYLAKRGDTFYEPLQTLKKQYPSLPADIWNDLGSLSQQSIPSIETLRKALSNTQCPNQKVCLENTTEVSWLQKLYGYLSPHIKVTKEPNDNEKAQFNHYKKQLLSHLSERKPAETAALCQKFIDKGDMPQDLQTWCKQLNQRIKLDQLLNRLILMVRELRQLNNLAEGE